MKRLFSILLLLTIATHILHLVLVFAAFKYNQDYIASELCENKTRPELKCDGKCFLKKQIKNVEEPQHIPFSFKKLTLLNFYYISQIIPTLPKAVFYLYEIDNPISKLHPTDFSFISRLLVNSLLRPPSFQ